MSVRVHKVVSKVEMEQGNVVKTEIHPDDNWVLIDGAPDLTIIQRFRAQDRKSLGHAITTFRPNDAIRIRVKLDTMDGKIEISVDRER